MKIKKFKKLLVANRSEIAIRVFRAATELGIRTVAIYSHEDRFALHRFKADEAYQVGTPGEPVKAYLDIEGIIALAVEKEVDAIHPGYGFLSENAEFAKACAKAGIAFIGPAVSLLEGLGDKMEAKKVAKKAEVPILSGGLEPLRDIKAARAVADDLGFPVIVKAAHGGGGRGMRVVNSADELQQKLEEAQRESLTAFGSDECFIEKFIVKAKHIEVQILGDLHGNLVHLYDRDCSLQRRHQKIIEVAPSVGLSDELREDICQAAVKICKSVDYQNAGTVEFLLDTDTNKFFFIEINPRIQVEHTVTETVTGLDIVKRQILVAQGHPLDSSEIGITEQSDIKVHAYAFQCRITTEDPANNFIPDYGKIEHYRSSGGMGIRLDAGTAFSGALVTPYYDSMLVKVTSAGSSFEDAVQRMNRALQEFRIRGVKTNIPFVTNLVNEPDFVAGKCTTRFIDEKPELFHFPKKRDRATKLLRFLGEVSVNGNPLLKGKDQPKEIVRRVAPIPTMDLSKERPEGTRDRLLKLGPEAFTQEILKEKKLFITDTTMRDAHQSLFATRMRTHDMLNVAERYSREHSDLFSMEMWGGATFDTSMRFLKESPWDRLRKLRKACPNILFQMLFRGSNGVGYTNYPDNVVREFIQRCAAEGMDVFRIFDSLNWVENMKVAIEETLKTGAICEATVCYTGDILDVKRTKYTLEYYVKMAKELESLGAHMIALKDMAGLLKPYAASELISALKAEVNIPIHLHTHDTSSGQLATLVKAAEAGVDVVDCAFGPLSGLTSQANLNTLVEMMRYTDRETGMEYEPLERTAEYWGVVRQYYSAFETSQRYGAADVYRHEMPGGQYTNLFQQAASLGLAERWFEVCDRYRQVNEAFGDIVKVTPSSKVVGDMALMLVANNLQASDLTVGDKDVAFPQSVVDMMQGWLGQPEGGFPTDIREKVLKGKEHFTDRPGLHKDAMDLAEVRAEVEKKLERKITDCELMAYVMYPDVFVDFANHKRVYGEVMNIPTPVYFYGLPMHEEVQIELDEGKTLFIKLVAIGAENQDGECTVYFELNGQPRSINIITESAAANSTARRQAELGNEDQVGAPMPGLLVNVHVKVGDEIRKNTPIAVMEAMKMETTIMAERDGVIAEVLVVAGDNVKAKDLLVVYK
ncbi:pyruvate carboxylase [Lentisphaera marina]|uniref:pyruvate carboxylase n=1 Tax=Lentisphaera marina TaxID=1111041 RepID=UPI002366FE00|nr:pyruvate carboxylase [Lentisphaera marina]MDD7984536.1 pyruvate carboxylase [Lentisphaera marina]